MLKPDQIILNSWRQIVWGRAYPRPLCLPQSTLTSSVSRRQHSSSEHLERRFTAQHSRLLSSCRDGTLCLEIHCFPPFIPPLVSWQLPVAPIPCIPMLVRGSTPASLKGSIPPQLQCSAPHCQGAAVTLLLCWCSRQYPCHYRNPLPFPYCSERKST